MAQTGYTPISFYYSSTSSNIPSAGNLVPGEIAINTADGVIYYKNSGGSVVPLQFGSTGISWQSVQTANFTATAGNGYPVNTTSEAITVLLPATPAAGDLVTLTDYAGTFATNNLIIDPNGNKLLASTDAVKMATNNESLSFVYIDSTQGWLPYDGFNSSIPATALYLIQASLRFRSSNSAYLSKTFSTTGTSTTIKTISVWVKRGKVNDSSNAYQILGCWDGSATRQSQLSFATGGPDQLVFEIGGNSAYNLVTNAIYRDPAAWYHIVIAVDTTQATASNRMKMYVNGNQITSFASTNYPPQNQTVLICCATTNNRIGSSYNNSGNFFDGYLAEMNVIDGQALTPSSFGQVSTTTGSWIPIQYTGTYGTNGFYLKFTNTSSVAALGTDFSGNGNTWTVNNVSLTAGSTYDSMYDVPTLTSATKANYCVINPFILYQSPITVSNGNLTGSNSGSNTMGTFGATSGKFYAEAVFSTIGTGTVLVGVQSFETFVNNNTPCRLPGSVGYRNSDGQKTVDNSNSAYGSTWTTGDVIGVAIDIDGGTITFYKNNVSQGAISYVFTGKTWTFATGWGGANSTDVVNWNYGQQPFVYTPPTGYVALNTFNL